MNPLLGYRSASWQPVPAWRCWWPLVRHEFGSLFRTRWGIAVFFVCMLPTLGRLVMVLMFFGVITVAPRGVRGPVSARMGPTLDPMRAEFYAEQVLSVMPGMVFTLLLSTLVVARAIARDRTTNALELFWTRSISPWGYLLAKWLASWLLVGTMTVAAPFVLWLTAVFLAEDWTLLTESAGPMALVLVGLTLVTALWTGIAICISAICSSPNTAMVLWCMLLVGSSAIGVVLARVLGEPSLASTLSVWQAGGVVVRAIAGFAQRGVSVTGSAGLLLVVAAVLLARALRRLRMVEAVA